MAQRLEGEPQPILPPAFITEDKKRVYPMRAVAKHLGISPVALFDHIKAGNISGYKPGREWFVSPDDYLVYKEGLQKRRSTRFIHPIHRFTPNQ